MKLIRIGLPVHFFSQSCYLYTSGTFGCDIPVEFSFKSFVRDYLIRCKIISEWQGDNCFLRFLEIALKREEKSSDVVCVKEEMKYHVRYLAQDGK